MQLMEFEPKHLELISELKALLITYQDKMCSGEALAVMSVVTGSLGALTACDHHFTKEQVGDIISKNSEIGFEHMLTEIAEVNEEENTVQ